MWRTLLVAACFILPALGQDSDDTERHFLEQSEVTFPLPVILKELEDVPTHSPAQRQLENPVRKKPSVLFPLERPDTHNIGSVCQHLGQRETYPPGSLPSTGFSHLQRQADALRRMEHSFAACCRKVGAGERLECALDGWKQSLDLFCSEEFSIKTRVHDCCREREEEVRHDCFALAAPPRSYLPPINASHSKSPACPPDGSASPDQDTDCDHGHRRFIEQSEVTFPLSKKEDVPAQSPPPWQTENPVRKKPSVLFPLERPDTHNIGSVCQHLGQRETYPPGSLPSTGFSHLQRQADALRRMEQSFAACCRKVGAGEQLECALDGWKQSLDLFCSEEFSIKTRVHDCCQEREEEARHDCFALAAPPRSYLPRPASPQVNFPPPQPDRGNIGNICRLQRFRPRPGLPSDPSGHRVRQTGLVHSLESHYKECCLGHRRLQCALQKWSELLSSLCKEPGEAEGGSSPCCLKSGDKRGACFRESARFRNYDREVHTVSLAQLTEQTIDVLCRSPLRVASKGPQKLLVSKLRKNCCKLQTPESKVECGIREKTSFVGKACSRFAGRWRDHLDCCSQETASCFDTGYLAQVKLFAVAA